MEKRLKDYLALWAAYDFHGRSGESKEERQAKELLIQIQFFQHERLVHLIVTVTFALLMMLSVIGCFLTEQIAMLGLSALFFVLLIPYIRHYYILENGVQKLYTYYDQLIQD